MLQVQGQPSWFCNAAKPDREGLPAAEMGKIKGLSLNDVLFRKRGILTLTRGKKFELLKRKCGKLSTGLKTEKNIYNKIIFVHSNNVDALT